MEQAIALRSSVPSIVTPDDEFDPQEFRVFTSIPNYEYYGIATLRGMVVVYDEYQLRAEGIIEGAFYVRERQRTNAGYDWEEWLRRELEDRGRRCGPYSR